VLKHGARYHASDVPDEDAVSAWYELGCEMLDAGGVRQYEISNFAHEGHASRHNLKYWKRQPYRGFGLDAHSMLETKTGAVRFANTDNLESYLARPEGPFVLLPDVDASRGEPEFLGDAESFEESLFLGLRLNEGVRLDGLRRAFGADLVESVMSGVMDARDAGLLELHGDVIRLTSRGRMASNEVFSRLLVPATV
jgi:oxygen-independent coproporphyrinogen-3 oxidase